MKLKHGLNLGGYLSQCVHTPEHYASFIVEQDLSDIRSMGFDHVRLPIDYNVFEEDNGTSKPEGWDLVTRVVDWCEAQGLDLILDLHKAYGYDFNDAGNAAQNNLFTSEPLQDRFVALWESIARHYGTRKHVAFELLNEVVEKDKVDLWNSLIRRTVTAIRAIAPQTLIIYGGIQWNSARTLKYLEKPLDSNILFTFHFYEPLLFTHQKAPWVPTIDPQADVFYPATREDYLDACIRLGEQGEPVVDSKVPTIDIHFLESVMKEAIEVSQKTGVPLYCGEFGVIDRAPTEPTLAWFRDTLELFRRFDIGFSMWSYKEMDFGLTEEHYEGIRGEMVKLLTE